MTFKQTRLNILSASILLASSAAFANVVSDTDITKHVKEALLLEKDVPAKDIEVITNHGIVTLKGTLDTKLQTDKAIEIASSIAGVEDVISGSFTSKNSDSVVMDSVLTAKVKGKIRHLYFNHIIAKGYDLHVETTNKVVHIFGEVGEAKDIVTIQSEVKKIKGVDSLKTNIRTVNSK